VRSENANTVDVAATAATGTVLQPLFDSHFHIVDTRFPLIPNNGYLPPEFNVRDYQAAVDGLTVTGGAVVSGSFQGFDQSYLLDALSVLGPGFVGVTQVRENIVDSQLRRLSDRGVRAVRFNLFRGGSEGSEHLLDLGRRAWTVAGMHVELYVDSGDLPDLEDVIGQLPRVSVDHLAMSTSNWDCVLRLVEKGVRVKATGFGRVAHDVSVALREIHTVDPHALMFGTDLPGTRAPRAFAPADITLIEHALGAEALPAVLHDNAMAFYGLP
jgi:predicted TIM-barrel fold metal-dependent hydrolase